jgi:hypothetical protein
VYDVNIMVINNVEDVSEGNVVAKIFSPTVVGWLVALLAGVLAPIFLQPYVSTVIAGLSSQADLVGGKIVEYGTAEFNTAVSVLVGVFSGWFVAVAHQLWLLVFSRRYGLVWSLVITAVGPAIVWFLLPALMQ